MSAENKVDLALEKIDQLLLNQLTRDQARQIVQEELSQAQALFHQEPPHQHGGDPHCPDCLDLAKQSLERARTEGIAEAHHYYAQIPGVPELQKEFQAAQEAINFTVS